MEQVLTRCSARRYRRGRSFPTEARPPAPHHDGGVNHANVAAVRVLESLGLRIPIFGMVA